MSSFYDFVEGLTPAEQEQLYLQLEKHPLAAPQSGPQTAAFQSEADVLGYGGAAGGGKGSFLYNSNQTLTEVITATGGVKLNEIEPGLQICDAFGSTQKVRRTKDWHDWPIWRVSFSDGTSVDTTPEHDWTCWRSHVGRKSAGISNDSYRRVWGMDAAQVMETQEILMNMEKGRRYRVPLCEPAIGNYNKYKIDPYLLGVLLGDGYMPKRKVCQIGIHPSDQQILAECNRREPMLTIHDINKRGILTANLSVNSKNHARLRDMGMVGKLAWEKELPKSCYFTPIEWRWELLQGLMDTDGWVEDKRCAYYCTTSPRLRDGVARLARSLGCFVTITNKFPTYTHKGEKLQGRDAYTLRIKSATPDKLFKLKRKKLLAEQIEHQSLAKEIVDIEDLKEKGTVRCIEVSHPYGLYLTNDYTVTHNSALTALLAIYEHERTVIFRREKAQMKSLIDDVVMFYGSDKGLNRQDGVFRLDDRPNHVIEYAGLSQPGEEQTWRGRPHDFIAFEEATEIPFTKVQFVMGWLRTTTPGQRCRVLMTFNPPGTADDSMGQADQKYVTSGRWVVDYFAPWLSERHPNPAQPGELRWFYRDDNGKEIETLDPRERTIIVNGDPVQVKPQSRTFIPALVTDNKYLANTGYVDHLNSLPEPFRSQMLMGNFRSAIVDDERQVLKSDWVDAAMDRWVNGDRGRKKPMNALGVDVSRGGNAFTVIARRHEFWWDTLIRFGGKDSDDGEKVAKECVAAMRDGAEIDIDVLGPGSSPHDFLKKANVNVQAVVSNARKGIPQPEMVLKMYNLRTALWWLLRKIFDPANGCEPAIPKDDRLRSELLAVRYDIQGVEVKVEPKIEVVKRLGFSPDEADAVAYSVRNVLSEPWGRRLAPSASPEIDKSLVYRGFPLKQNYGWLAR